MEQMSTSTENGSVGATSQAVPTADAVRDTAIRRCIDVSVAALVVLALAPLLVVIALAICLDSHGPAIFRQRRLGRAARPFTVLKFRTMGVDSDAAPHREYVRSLIAGARDDDDAAPARADGLYKLVGDDRITPVGHLLRRWSLDELPQLLNVLRGEMALVGPRPVIPYEVEHYPDWYRRRFAVPPGLTGLWQVSGRNERTYEEMVRFDIEYATRRSVRLDLSILARTVRVVLGRRGVA
jgi:lipopolysaccharide/colanic/teichoic acid biosynthesis glycosyltransferase